MSKTPTDKSAFIATIKSNVSIFANVKKTIWKCPFSIGHKLLFYEIRHKYLRSHATKCLSPSSQAPLYLSLHFCSIKILVPISWISHPWIYEIILRSKNFSSLSIHGFQFPSSPCLKCINVLSTWSYEGLGLYPTPEEGNKKKIELRLLPFHVLCMLVLDRKKGAYPFLHQRFWPLYYMLALATGTRISVVLRTLIHYSCGV